MHEANDRNRKHSECARGERSGAANMTAGRRRYGTAPTTVIVSCVDAGI